MPNTARLPIMTILVGRFKFSWLVNIFPIAANVLTIKSFVIPAVTIGFLTIHTLVSIPNYDRPFVTV